MTLRTRESSTNADVSWLTLLLTRELDSFQRELELFPNELLVWSTLPGIANSAGTLALHVSGNLQHYIGAVLGGTGYVRDRDREFSASGIPRAELSAQLRRAAGVVTAVLHVLPDSALSAEYPDVLGGSRMPTGLFLHHLSAHLAHHLGQAGYLRRSLTGESRTSGAISMKALTFGGARTG